MQSKEKEIRFEDYLKARSLTEDEFKIVSGVLDFVSSQFRPETIQIFAAVLRNGSWQGHIELGNKFTKALDAMTKDIMNALLKGEIVELMTSGQPDFSQNGSLDLYVSTITNKILQEAMGISVKESSKERDKVVITLRYKGDNEDLAGLVGKHTRKGGALKLTNEEASYEDRGNNSSNGVDAKYDIGTQLAENMESVAMANLQLDFGVFFIHYARESNPTLDVKKIYDEFLELMSYLSSSAGISNDKRRVIIEQYLKTSFPRLDSMQETALYHALQADANNKSQTLCSLGFRGKTNDLSIKNEVLEDMMHVMYPKIKGRLNVFQIYEPHVKIKFADPKKNLGAQIGAKMVEMLKDVTLEALKRPEELTAFREELKEYIDGVRQSTKIQIQQKVDEKLPVFSIKESLYPIDGPKLAKRKGVLDRATEMYLDGKITAAELQLIIRQDLANAAKSMTPEEQEKYNNNRSAIQKKYGEEWARGVPEQIRVEGNVDPIAAALFIETFMDLEIGTLGITAVPDEKVGEIVLQNNSKRYKEGVESVATLLNDAKEAIKAQELAEHLEKMALLDTLPEDEKNATLEQNLKLFAKRLKEEGPNINAAMEQEELDRLKDKSYQFPTGKERIVEDVKKTTQGWLGSIADKSWSVAGSVVNKSLNIGGSIFSGVKQVLDPVVGLGKSGVETGLNIGSSIVGAGKSGIRALSTLGDKVLNGKPKIIMGKLPSEESVQSGSPSANERDGSPLSNRSNSSEEGDKAPKLPAKYKEVEMEIFVNNSGDNIWPKEDLAPAQNDREIKNNQSPRSGDEKEDVYVRSGDRGRARSGSFAEKVDNYRKEESKSDGRSRSGSPSRG